jgi:hypothetical protein
MLQNTNVTGIKQSDRYWQKNVNKRYIFKRFAKRKNSFFSQYGIYHSPFDPIEIPKKYNTSAPQATHTAHL